MTPPEHVQRVRETLRRYVETGPSEEAGVRAVAAKHGLLPVLMDWTAFVGLSPEGEMLWVNYEAPHDPRGLDHAAVLPEQMRHLALIAAAHRYPELAFLKPERTPESVECRLCKGTGTAIINGQPAPSGVVCECGGVGWLPGWWEGTALEGGRRCPTKS